MVAFDNSIRSLRIISRVILIMVSNIALSDLYYSGGIGTRTITDNFQTTYGDILNITHGGETEFDTRFAIGYMPFRSIASLPTYDYFVECGLSAFPHDVTYNGEGSGASSSYYVMTSDSYIFGRLGAMLRLSPSTFTYLQGTMEHTFDEQYEFTTPLAMVEVPSTSFGGGIGMRIISKNKFFLDSSFTFVKGSSVDAFIDGLEVVNRPRRATFIGSIGRLF